MPDLVLVILKYVFLAMLWIFVARAVRAVLVELRPAKAAAPARGAPVPAQPPPRKSKKPPAKAVVVEGGTLRGKSFPLGSELTIGRSEQCHVHIDGDIYVSSVHARIFRETAPIWSKTSDRPTAPT
ncbi:MAG: FHA domain-containing protein [Actinomycetota bacterium]|nr:FHA domain-containing protein [Actinomycetota bacterium]